MDKDIVKEIIDKHEQRQDYSCIPSAVEMILKLEGKVDFDYYDLQNKWNNFKNGNFSDFHNIELFGLEFQKEFGFDRSDSFPIDELFNRIDSILNNDALIVISLVVPLGWHNYIIFSKNDKCDYNAISKNGMDTIVIDNVKERVKIMKGTDILTYKRNIQ